MGKTGFYNSKFNQRSFPIAVITDHVTSDRNIGSLFRICDAFGVKELIICGLSEGLGRKGRQTSRSTENYVSHEYHDDTLTKIKELQTAGYKIISLEITEESIPLHMYKVPLNKPLALVIGDERYGVSDAVLSISDDVVHVEMYGQNSSMNVVQATNAALYELTRQLH
ncbi:MAG: TrmH family RNA methyltransferase [Flavobacteriaceae bacterium]|nr:TrmH family RNA methyltransferase [Flavobacteriaceae bacterium]NNK71120.1 TrmH family RNA methyltransferase [Flavobacteriaceae bacterium]